MLLPCLSWLHLSTHVFAFFFFFLHTVTHPGFALSVCPHWHHQNTVKGSMWEGERENERQWERERGRFRDALWVTPLNEARYTAPLQQSILQSLFCTCTVNIWERRGEERSEGGAAFEQRWVFTHCLSRRCSPLSSPLALPNCLCALPHFFYFHPILVSFILLTSHILLTSSAFFFCFWL